MAAEIATDVAKDIAYSVVGAVIQQIKNVVELEGKLEILNTDFRPVKSLLLQIEQQFQDQQRRLPEAIKDSLGSMGEHLQKGQLLINRAKQQQRRCFGGCLMCSPNLFTQIADWETRFRQLFQVLNTLFSISANSTEIVSTAAPQAEVLRQPIPGSGFVGSTIESAQMQVQAWLGEAHPQARMVGICGMGGVGKTSLLKLVFNHFKDERGIFDVVIWLTISQHYQVERLQASIAETLDLKLEGVSDSDTRKMKLSESLGKKKFLLIMDDLWRPIDLIDEVGIKFGDHRCSKVLMSSRSREVISAMEASEEYTLKIQTLSEEEGWELFRTKAFTDGILPRENNIEGIAREIASECQGLPLALNTVAATMRRKKTEDEWRRALTLMRTADPAFQASHSIIDRDLYKRLKLSYDDLPARNLKICFLYCAVFPEDAEIPVETLLEMWSAEKLITQMDAGHEYIDVLVDRGLLEHVAEGNRGKAETIKLGNGVWVESHEGKRVKVHDVVRDLAIYIGRSEEKWLFATVQHLQNFPTEDEIRDCKRISVGHNDIQDLPTDLVCSQVVSLVLANNESIREVPQRFFSTAISSLKVLDLSQCISITSLPTSLGQLEQLEFLKLTGCYSLQTLLESTGNLSRLRFLNLQYCTSLYSLPDNIGNLRNLNKLNLESCTSLNSLPDNIGNLTNLKHLHLEDCDSLMAIPHGISHLTSLNKLFLPVAPNSHCAINVEDIANSHCAINVEDIANFSNLMELTANLECKNIESTMTTWTELRRLEVSCVYDADRDDVGEEHIFPFNMDNLNKLEHFTLYFYKGVSLPNCIPQFQNLRELELWHCEQLRELPGIVGGWGFPMLKSLILYESKLESMMVGSSVSVLSSEETMPQLEGIGISNCSSLKRLRTRKLPRLKNLSISSCTQLEALEIESCGLPMLEYLSLSHLEKCETIVGPSGVINDGVMPKLQYLYINSCPSLRILVLEKLSNLRDIQIEGCNELRELAVGSGGFPALETLVLRDCPEVENMVGPHDAWDDQTMPQLRSLKIVSCPLLKTLPRGMEKLSRLQQIYGEAEWWQNLIWEDENVKNSLFPLFIEED